VAASATSIERALASADAEERRQATTELGGVPLDEALPLLLRSLGDEDWRVRKEATLAARAFGPAPALLAALVRELAEGDNVGLRNAAVDVLAGAGHAATRGLSSALPGLDADGRKLVVETLGKGRDPAALGALEGALRDPDDNVRQGAIEAIAGLGALARDRVQALLLGRLDDRDRVVRLTALEGLTALEVAIPWERLAPLLDDASLRASALSAAALADSPEAARALAGALGKARGAAFHQAMMGLGRLAEGPLASAVADALRAGGPELGGRLVAAALADGRGDETASRRGTALRLAAAAGAPGVVDAAVGALAEDLLAEPAQQVLAALGAPALPEMVARLGDVATPPEARAALVDAIREVAQQAGAAASAPAMPALRAAARDADRHVAVRALRALSHLGEETDLPLVAAQTLSGVRPVATAAEGALSALAARFPAAARALVDGLAPDEASILPGAIALGAASAASVFEERDATFLARAATAGDTRARRAAVQAVSELRGAVGAAFPGAMEVLRIALADEEHEVQVAAARALGRMCTARDPPRASDVLELVERSGEADLIATTVRAIGEGMARAQGRVAADLVPALGLFARGAPSPVAMAAVEALGEAQRAGAPEGVDGLAAALDHPDEAVVKAALLKLAAAGPVALPVLARGLEHPSTAVRILAAEMLADAESDEARRWLVKQLFAEPDRKVKEAIQRVLAPHGGGAPDHGEGGS
jgi:HEAT repeat protein